MTTAAARIGHSLSAAFGAGRVARRAARLVAAGRLDEADRLVVAALRHRPDDPRLLERHALTAHDAGRHAEALERWRSLAEVAPDNVMVAAGVAANLRELRRLEEAWATIMAAIARHPDDAMLISEAGRIANRRHDHVEALALWQRIAERDGAPPEWRQARDWNLVFLGRLDEADAAIAQACRLQPGCRGHFANRALLSMARGDWDGAVAQLTLFRQRFPDDEVAATLLGQAMEGRAFAHAELPVRAAPVSIERVVDDPLRDRLLAFESIGIDCEFGLVQRRYGAEPLGLLRWNEMDLRRLLVALDSDFAGLGDRVNTEIALSELDEYRAIDTRYGMNMHTFQHRHQVSPDELLEKMTKRLAFLRERLLRDLASAQKVFVYKNGQLTAETLHALHAALRRHGPVHLLGVTAGEPRPGLPLVRPGEVAALAPDLHLGWLGRIGNAGRVWDIAYPDWISICAAPAFEPFVRRKAPAASAGRDGDEA